jgi:hypothetical protein
VVWLCGHAQVTDSNLPVLSMQTQPANSAKRASMFRSPFPVTPTMRYERMLVVAVTALVAGLVGFAFLVQALDAAQFLTFDQLRALAGPSLQVLTLFLLAAACLSLALSFFCSFAIKIHISRMQQLMPIYLGLQRLALGFLFVACGIAFAIAAPHAIAGLLK